MLSDEVDARLRFEARRRHVSVAELVREAVEARYSSPAPRKLSFFALPRDPGYPEPPVDAASRMEELMAEDRDRDLRELQRDRDADR
jgi:hypothetical protein